MDANELIAEFMGEVNPFKDHSVLPFQYDTSWDWLMPVVHKILRNWVPESGGWPYEYKQLSNLKLGTSIEFVHERVVDFIQWHNQQKQISDATTN